MTTLISWFGRDSHGPASLYLAADSRITWGGSARWDRGRKLFASSRYGEIIGYCGDAFFPTQLLGQAKDFLDRELLYDAGATSEEKLTAIRLFIDRALETYTAVAFPEFDLVFASRTGVGLSCEFHLHRASLRAGSWSTIGPIALPSQSALLLNLGTGASAVTEEHRRWATSSSGGTSRAVFSAFHDAVMSGADDSSGGPPQLVGLYREGPARVFGYVRGGRRYVLGSEAPLSGGACGITWFNGTFERCDPLTGAKLPEAQRQPRPNDLRSRS